MKEASIGEILRSCQRAFLFNINGNVKSISVNRIENILLIRAFFYKVPTLEENKMITNAGGEIYGDFKDIEDWKVECLESSGNDEYLECLIFARSD